MEPIDYLSYIATVEIAARPVWRPCRACRAQRRSVRQGTRWRSSLSSRAFSHRLNYSLTSFIRLMFKSTATQKSAHTPSAPQGKTASQVSNLSPNHEDAATRQKTAQQKVEFQLSKFESAQIKNTTLLEELHCANMEKQAHQAKLKIHTENLKINQDQAGLVARDLIDANTQILHAPSKNSIQTLQGPTDPFVLMRLIQNDPTLIKMGAELRDLQQSVFNETMEISAVQSSIDQLLKDKDSVKAEFDNARIELIDAIDALDAAKAWAANDDELQHLLGIANQKIAAADFSTASKELSLAQENFQTAKHLVSNSLAKLQKITKALEIHHIALNKAQDEFLASGKYKNKSNNLDKEAYKTEVFSDPKNKDISDAVLEQIMNLENETTNKNFLNSCLAQTESHLSAATAKFQQAETTLNKWNAVVEKANMALEQSILQSMLSSSADEGLPMNQAPGSVTAESHAGDEVQVYEPVVATGMDAHLELL